MVRGSLFGAMLLAVGCSAFDAQLEPLRYHAGAPDAQVEDDGSVPVDMDAALPDSGPRDAGMDAGDAGQDAAHDGMVTDADLDAGGDSGGDADGDAGCGNGPGEVDCCLSDPAKDAPGVCGCGVPDTDRDADDTPDCVDDCPDDADKTEPGVCGCGLADEGASVTCNDLRGPLVHRYPFDGTGVTVTDTVGTAHGLLLNASLADTGACTLAGAATEQHVDLPNAILASLTNVTIEAWVAWNGVGDWTRIFDFGNSNATEGNQGSSGTTFIFLTPRYAGAGGVMRLVYSTTGSTGQTVLDGTTVLPSDGVHHVAAVFDDTGNTLRLYLDGELEGSTAFTGALGSITYINNWLGRSQYNSDAEFGGALHEARIYNEALSDEQIAFSFAQGPDPDYLE